jgi:hypothetical protein
MAWIIRPLRLLLMQNFLVALAPIYRHQIAAAVSGTSIFQEFNNRSSPFKWLPSSPHVAVNGLLAYHGTNAPSRNFSRGLCSADPAFVTTHSQLSPNGKTQTIMLALRQPVPGCVPRELSHTPRIHCLSAIATHGSLRRPWHR